MIDRCFLQVEGVDRDVADVGDLQAVEGRRARRHVVGPNQAAFGADLARAEAGAGAVGGADVHRHADEAGVETLGGRPASAGASSSPGPPKRGISLPPSGWLKLVMAGFLRGRRVPADQAAAAATAAAAARSPPSVRARIDTEQDARNRAAMAGADEPWRAEQAVEAVADAARGFLPERLVSAFALRARFYSARAAS